MINYSEIVWKTAEDKQYKQENNIKGMAIAYVIGDDVVNGDVIDFWAGEILCSADSFIENNVDELNGIYTVDIIKDNIIINTIVCDEMIYSILLSDAKVYDIDDGHQYARLVMEGWKFLDGTFKLPGVYE